MLTVCSRMVLTRLKLAWGVVIAAELRIPEPDSGPVTGAAVILLVVGAAAAASVADCVGVAQSAQSDAQSSQRRQSSATTLGG